MQKSIVMGAMQKLPDSVRGTLFLRAFGLMKVPLIFYCSPSVLELNSQKCIVKIPLRRKTKNHLGSMYFGALAIGADCAGGIIAMQLIYEEGNRVNLVFKDMQAEFLKRPEGDVHFVCEDGPAILDTVRKAIETGERENVPVHIRALVPSASESEVYARFTLTLSLKRKRG